MSLDGVKVIVSDMLPINRVQLRESDDPLNPYPRFALRAMELQRIDVLYLEGDAEYGPPERVAFVSRLAWAALKKAG